MLFSEIKTSDKYVEEKFRSNFTIDAIFKFNEEFNTFINMESDISSIINESIIYDDMFLLSEGTKDYMDNIEKYLKDSIKYIENMWNKFSMEHNMSKREISSLIARTLHTIDVSGNYSFSGYRYTIGDENIHIDRYLVQNPSQIRQQLASGFETVKDKFKSEEYFDNLRGRFIDGHPLNNDDFRKALHRKYRDGKFRPVKIVVTEEVKDEMLDAIFEVDRNLSSCIYLKNDIIAYVKSMLSYFAKLKDILDEKKEILRHSNEVKLFKIDDIEELAHTQIAITRRILHIYTFILTAKLDAINERQRKYSEQLEKMAKIYNDRGDDEDDE